MAGQVGGGLTAKPDLQGTTTPIPHGHQGRFSQGDVSNRARILVDRKPKGPIRGSIPQQTAKKHVIATASSYQGLNVKNVGLGRSCSNF